MTDADLDAGQGASATEIAIEVAYALPHRQWLVTLRVPRGTTASAAVEAAGLELRVGEPIPWQGMLGIFGERVADDRRLEAGDRVEINRPLVHDPMEARRLRARGELPHHRTDVGAVDASLKNEDG